jgi:hypothetical protein
MVGTCFVFIMGETLGRIMAIGQALGLPSVIPALQMVLRLQLARIAASSPQHVWSGRSCYGTIEKLCWPSVAAPVARTTAKSR